MTWFIFTGDLLVMLFMTALVVWVFMVAADEDIAEAAQIPLADEDYGDAAVARGNRPREGERHG